VCYDSVTSFGILLYLCLRFVDPDMLMWYHWGLGIGHIYSHGHTEGHSTAVSATAQASDTRADDEGPEAPAMVINHQDDSDFENPEFGLENEEDDLWEIEESSRDSKPDEELLTMVDTYGECVIDDSH
jgi:hypothetical protein